MGALLLFFATVDFTKKFSEKEKEKSCNSGSKDV